MSDFTKIFFCFRNDTLDLLIADTPILDYYRATDHGCKLQRIGDQALAQDSYGIGMTKGFPLKVNIFLLVYVFHKMLRRR